MKVALSIVAVTLLVASCQKDISSREQLVLQSQPVADNAAVTLPCHTISLVSDYPFKWGAVPPFTFTKTLYADSRVKSISMLSREYPISQYFSSYALELKGQFTYGPKRAYLKGTVEEFLYYQYTNGDVRRSTGKKNINLKFYINDKGYCEQVMDLDKTTPGYPESSDYPLLSVIYNGNYNGTPVLDYIAVRRRDRKDNANGWVFYMPKRDQYGNTLEFYFPSNEGGYNSYTTYQYDYNIPRGNKKYSFIPSQNLISQEYSLLEVMQWVPPASHQRKATSGVFFLSDNTKVVQSQVYKNFKFDSKGNQTSVTYADNVLQHTAWSCK